MSEDEVSVIRFGNGAEVVYQMGLQMALLRVRGAYIAGRIEVDEFERETGRLLHELERTNHGS